MIRTHLILPSIFAILVAPAPWSRAATWDVAADYSASINPSGAWTYGWAETWTPGYTFTTYDTMDNVEGLQRWRTSSARTRALRRIRSRSI